MIIYPSCTTLRSVSAPLFRSKGFRYGSIRLALLTAHIDVLCVPETEDLEGEYGANPAYPEFWFSNTVAGRTLADVLECDVLASLVARAVDGTTEVDGDVLLSEDAKLALAEIGTMIRDRLEGCNAHCEVRTVKNLVDLGEDYHTYWGELDCLDSAVSNVETAIADAKFYEDDRLIVEDEGAIDEMLLGAALDRFRLHPYHRNLHWSHVEALMYAGKILQEEALAWKRVYSEDE